MRIFSSEKIDDLLLFDGEAQYYGDVLNEVKSKKYFDILLKTIDWKPDEVVIAGKRILTKRLVAWYGDSPYSYTYSGTTKQALAWTKELLELRERAASITGEVFNSCLLNFYHDGTEGVGWHSDNEDCFIKNATIASFSLGATRRFLFKHRKSKETITVELENGSLLAMKGETQTHWLHSLPKSLKVTEPRINLTFRMVSDLENN
jgi:alkylated DNA repair dioxygenase AlkB